MLSAGPLHPFGGVSLALLVRRAAPSPVQPHSTALPRPTLPGIRTFGPVSPNPVLITMPTTHSRTLARPPSVYCSRATSTLSWGLRVCCQRRDASILSQRAKNLDFLALPQIDRVTGGC